MGHCEVVVSRLLMSKELIKSYNLFIKLTFNPIPKVNQPPLLRLTPH